MKTFLTVIVSVCVLSSSAVQGIGCIRQKFDQMSQPNHGETLAKRSLDLDSLDNLSDSFEDFTPRRLVRSQQLPKPLVTSAKIESEQTVSPLQKRASILAEKLNIKPFTLGSGLSKLGLAKTAAPVVVAEPAHVVTLPAVETNAIVWDPVELAKLTHQPLVQETPVVAVAQPVLAEKKAVIDALLQEKKAELLKKKAQFDLTVAQKKAVFQTEGTGFDRNAFLNKFPSLRKAEV